MPQLLETRLCGSYGSTTHVFMFFYEIQNIWLLLHIEVDKKFFIFQAQASLSESNQKSELLRISLEKRINELGPGSAKVDMLKQELDAAGGPSSYSKGSKNNSLKNSSPLSKAAAITGKLEVR